MELPDWYKDLLKGAAEAEEVFHWTELEGFAEECNAVIPEGGEVYDEL